MNKLFLRETAKRVVFQLNRTFFFQPARLSFFAIRGFPKSGTTWLGSLMNLHPKILVTGEWELSKLSDARHYILQDALWTACHDPYMKGYLDEAFEAMVKDVMIRHASSQSLFSLKSYLGDKTPGAAYPPVIRASKCLYIVRDVRDVTVSRAYHLLRVKGLWGLKAFPAMMQKLEMYHGNLQYFKDNPEQLLTDLDWVRSNVRLWAQQVEQALKADELGFTQQYPNYSVKIIRYEDLYADVERIRNECYGFLGLDPKQALPLDSGATKTSPGLPSENPQNFYRKGVVGDWKNYFNPELEEIVLEEAEGLLRHFSYID